MRVVQSRSTSEQIRDIKRLPMSGSDAKRKIFNTMNSNVFIRLEILVREEDLLYLREDSVSLNLLNIHQMKTYLLFLKAMSKKYFWRRFLSLKR